MRGKMSLARPSCTRVAYVWHTVALWWGAKAHVQASAWKAGFDHLECSHMSKLMFWRLIVRGKMSLARPSCHGWPNWQGKRGHSAWLKAHVNLTLAKMVVLEECRWPPLWLKWQAWLPTIVHVRGTCGCPWPCPWQPSVLVRGTCGCPWPCPWQPTVRVRGSCGRPSSCMSLAAHRACPWHKWQPMAVPTCMSVAHVAAHGRALVSVFGTAHGRANVHVRGKPLCMPVAQVAAHRRALARVLGSPTFNSVAQVADHGRPWPPITMPLPRACPCHKWLPIVHVRGANGLGQCTRHTPCANAMP